MRLYKPLCQSVGLSVGWSVAVGSEHATYGDWPCFLDKNTQHMFLTSLPYIVHNLVSMAVHLLWLLLMGQNPTPPSCGKEDILKAVGIRVNPYPHGPPIVTIVDGLLYSLNFA